MKEKPISVEPALKVYVPSYPSYADKNPLEYPGTIPYPFTQRFIKWASIGGMTSLILFQANQGNAQSTQDSLYNPFKIENARVPYRPSSFGTGLPERLESQYALQAIKKAFKDSGIKLEENVWLEDKNLGVEIDGYSRDEKIGFIYLNRRNMDDSYLLKGSKSEIKQQEPTIKRNIKFFKESSEREFKEFLENKEKFIELRTRYSKQQHEIQYLDITKSLKQDPASKDRFEQAYLTYRIQSLRFDNRKTPVGAYYKLFINIDSRFEDTVEKYALMQVIRIFKEKPKQSEEIKEFYQLVGQQLTELHSDKKFSKQLQEISNFITYNSRFWNLRFDPQYQQILLRIMKSYPINKWRDHQEELNEYYDRKIASLDEIKKIDRNNNQGKEFIVPIFSRDPIMIVPSNYFYDFPEIVRARQELAQEFNEKNGMTKEVLENKNKELGALRKESQSKRGTFTEDQKNEKRAFQKMISQKRREITKKYEAMETMSLEEREIYQKRFEDIERKRNELIIQKKEELQHQTMLRLEKEVKMYIKWARSQMGG